MKTINKSLITFVFLLSSLFAFTQGTYYKTEKVAAKERNKPIKGLTVQQIQKSVYGILSYSTDTSRLKLDYNISIMRDEKEIKKTATTPALFIDSLFYENILDAPLLDYQDLLLKRFPFLIMENVRAADKIMNAMDSLYQANPNISKDEYWYILKRDYADVISWSFKRINDGKQQILSQLYPYRKIGDIRMARIILNVNAIHLEHSLSIESKPYLERLGVLPSDSSYFARTKRETIITIEDF